MTWLLLAAGAAVGAPVRYLTDVVIRARSRATFPWATLVVNVVAAFVLGMLTGAAGHTSTELRALLGTGLCGALSTYSAFGYETLLLAQDARRGAALANVVLSLVAGIGAAALGWWLGEAVT